MNCFDWTEENDDRDHNPLSFYQGQIAAWNIWWKIFLA